VQSGCYSPNTKNIYISFRVRWTTIENWMRAKFQPMTEMFSWLSFLCRRYGSLWVRSKQKKGEERSPGEPSEVNKCKLCCPIVSGTDHIEGWTLERKAGTRGTCSAKFWSCTEHPMDHGLNGHCLIGLCPGDRPAKYILCLWATITIQYTQNWKTPVGLP
jgi:hypothetical protein